MKQLLMIAFAVLWSINASGCSPNDSPAIPEIPETGQPSGNNNNGGNTGNQGENESMKITIKVGSATFTATLADNETAKAFRAMLPMTINMSEHAGNEKYYDLSVGLSATASNSGAIRSGDIMLFGSKTLVLFYKTFSTSYSYTRIGSVDSPSGWEQALGTGSVTVTFVQGV